MLWAASVFLPSALLSVATGSSAHAQQTLCTAAPVVDCRVAARSTFFARNNPTNSERNRIIWRWHKGEGTAVAAFGDPQVATSYSLCVYDSSSGVGSLSLALDVPAGGDWKASGKKRFRYKDKQVRLRLKAGAARKSRIIFEAKGPSLSMPPTGRSSSSRRLDQLSATTPSARKHCRCLTEFR
ncbi:MAG: hypothetical protein ACE5D3_06135 [Candidatus Binatia bacterium]